MWDFNVQAEISSPFVCEVLADRASPQFSQNFFFVTQMKMGWDGRWTSASEGNCEAMTMVECEVLR